MSCAVHLPWCIPEGGVYVGENDPTLLRAMHAEPESEGGPASEAPHDPGGPASPWPLIGTHLLERLSPGPASNGPETPESPTLPSALGHASPLARHWFVLGQQLNPEAQGH